MVTQLLDNANSEPVALLVVHGIGNQKPGETLTGLIEGIRFAYKDQLIVDQRSEDHAILNNIGRQVHVIEVYWADLLHGETVKGTFDFERIFETIWFPLLNHKSGRLSPEVCPRSRVLRWTWVLAPLSSLLYAGFWGAKFLAIFPTMFSKKFREKKARQAESASSEGFLKRVQLLRNDPEKGRTLVDDLMDQYAGDVFNYVHGLADAFPAKTEQTQKIVANVREIHERFIRAAAHALDQGCKEIQVLAHSLGTVVAFNAMCQETRMDHTAVASARLSRFYTIGSPLEKFRFFWTPLIESSPSGPVIATKDSLIAGGRTADDREAMQWINYFNRLDLVSGRLQGFEHWPIPENLPAHGLGGLITAHVAYNRNPAFLAQLTEGLTGKPAEIHLSLGRRLGRSIMATFENLVLPAIFVVLAVIGMAFMAGIGLLSGWIWALPLTLFGLDSWARGLQIYFVASILFAMLIGGLFIGRSQAKTLYANFLASVKDE